MNGVPGQVALTGLGIVLLGVALAWLFVGREGRRRWMRELRQIGIWATFSRALGGLGVLFGTATVTETDLSYGEHLATMMLGVGCLSAGAFFGVKGQTEVSRRVRDHAARRGAVRPGDPSRRLLVGGEVDAEVACPGRDRDAGAGTAVEVTAA